MSREAEKKSVFFQKVKLELAKNNTLVARELSWKPLIRGGDDYRSRVLDVSPQCIRVVWETPSLILIAIAVIAGLLLIASGVFFIIEEQSMGWILSIVVGVWVISRSLSRFLKKGGELMVFDKNRDMYFCSETYLKESGPAQCEGNLTGIHALQVLREHISSSSTDSDQSEHSRTYYELNIVFGNAKRINVMDHVERKHVEASAQTLGHFLGVPVWHWEAFEHDEYRLTKGSIGDSVAQETDWNPAEKTTSAADAMQIEGEELHIKMFIGFWFFMIMFLLGFLPILGGGFIFLAKGLESLPLVLICIIGGAGIIYLLGKSWKKGKDDVLTFDKKRGIYFQGRKKPSKSALKNISGMFSDIHALQIVSERKGRSAENTFAASQLNLVLKDARRINLMRHNKPEEIEKFARTLAAFIDVPVWQAVY